MVWLGFQERTAIDPNNWDLQLRCIETLLAKTVIMIASSFSYYQEIIKRGNLESLSKDLWVKVFKNGPSKICGRQPLKNLKWHGLLRQISLQIV